MADPARQQVLLTIDSTPDSVEPLKLELQIVTPVRRGQPIQGRFVASGGTGDYVYSVDTHVFVLPAGVTMPDATTAVLTGTPTTIGHYEVEASVQDSSSTLVTERFAIDVITSLSIPPGHVPRIGEVGVPYLQPLFVLGAVGPVTWAFYSGTLHAGLVVDTLLGYGAAHGTPTGPGGISYAQLIATDTVSGDVLIVPFRTDIRDAMADTAPDDPIEVVAGVPAQIPLDDFWSGGVEPFELSALGGIPTGLFLFKNRARKWSMIGTPAFSFSGEDTLWSPVGITVKDALGASWDIAFQIMVRNPINSLGAERSGVSAGDRTLPVMDFAGSAVKSVSRAFDGSKFTVTIEPQAGGLSVLGCATSSAGDATSITAAANNRVLARVSNALVWTQITPAMMSATGTAGATNFLRGDGSWSQVTVGTISATGTPSATTFLSGSGAWSTPTIIINGNGGASFTISGSSPISASMIGTSMTISHVTSGIAAGTYDRVTFNTTGHATAGINSGTTIYSRSISASLAYAHLDFTSMTQETDVVRFTGAAGGTSTIRGLYDSPRAGQIVYLVNASTTTLTISNQDAGDGTAAARFAIGANFSLAPDHGCTLWYDGTAARWRIVGSY